LVRRLFKDQVMVPESIVQEIFADLPWEIASEALMELIDGRRFKLTRPDGVSGFLVKKAGYLVFQPAGVADTDIPMTLRYARGFQLHRHTMDSRMPVWGRAEEPGLAAAAPVAKKLVPVLAQGEEGEGEGEGAGGEGGGSSPILVSWSDWLAFVNSNGAADLPAGMSSTLRLWKWILNRYEGVPETRMVALRWWFDRLSYADRRSLLELAAAPAPSPVIEALQMTLKSDIYVSAKIVVYRVFNPEAMEVRFFSKPISGGTWGPAPSNVASLVDKALGNAAIPIPAGVGSLFGFMAAKADKMVFKTLDTTKPKKHSSVGAECGNTTNMGEHHPRVRLLHAAGLTTELAPLMLPDADETWIEDDAKDNMKDLAPRHMKDITRHPLCLYMEFLTRILDARHVGGRRWFMSAIEAIQSGLKGKK